MVFASGIFLFIFLPITFTGNWILRNKSTWVKNTFLLMMSAIFYLESGIGQFMLLIVTILVNYCFALVISLQTYIEETKPDLVVSMYSAYELNCGGAEGLFEFR